MDDHEVEEQTPGARAFVAILVGFKIWTLLLIALVMSSRSTIEFLVASHVLWIAAGAFFVWAPALFWLRLARGRARRRKLQAAEWHIEDTRPSLR